MSVSLKDRKTVIQGRRLIPFVYNEESFDEVFGLLGRIYKLWFIKVPLTGQDVIQSLVVIITKEGTETTQTNMERQIVIRTGLCMSVYVFECLLTSCR